MSKISAQFVLSSDLSGGVETPQLVQVSSLLPLVFIISKNQKSLMKDFEQAWLTLEAWISFKEGGIVHFCRPHCLSGTHVSAVWFSLTCVLINKQTYEHESLHKKLWMTSMVTLYTWLKYGKELNSLFNLVYMILLPFIPVFYFSFSTNSFPPPLFTDRLSQAALCC